METISSINKNKREKRVKKTAEVFTPHHLVEKILERFPKSVWEEDPENTFLDPACGNGNFLTHALWKKLSLGHDSLNALKTLYGLDIVQDNIKECRWRLLKMVSLFENISKDHIKAVTINVRWLKGLPNGSLDYDMTIKNNANNKDIDKWYELIQNGELELIDLPVSYDDINPAIGKDGKISKTYTDSIDLFEDE